LLCNGEVVLKEQQLITDLLQKHEGARLQEIFRDISSSFLSNTGFSCRGRDSQQVKCLQRRSKIRSKVRLNIGERRVKQDSKTLWNGKISVVVDNCREEKNEIV
jgi:hypothetical protein